MTQRRRVAEEEPDVGLPYRATIAAAIVELELEAQARAAARSAPSVVAVERAARSVEALLSELLAGGREGL